MPRLPEPQRRARRQAVVDGARRAFTRWGYAGATVKRLEEEIGLSRGAIFNWFPDKWSLFLAVTSEDQRLAIEQADSIGDIVDAATLVGLLPSFEHLGAYLEAITLMREDPAKRAAWQSRNLAFAPEIERRWEQLAAAGGVRTDIDLQDLSRFAFVVTDGLALQRALGQVYSREQLATFTRLLRDAVGPRVGTSQRPS